ncbi:PIR Superfamily Protein, partial [Plasmodium ovale curtisi]
MATVTPHGHGGIPGIYLSDLPTVNFYNVINQEYEDLHKYSKHCDEINLSKHEDEVKEICKKYLRYLEKSPLWKVENPAYNVCTLLNYWIYNKLIEIFAYQNTSENINIAFSRLQYIWEYTVNIRQNKTYYKNCKPDFDIFKNPHWKERKELYEYYIDYTTIKGLSDVDVNNCKAYYEYIEKKASLYKHFEGICLSDDSSCPNFYDKCLPYNPNSVLRNIRCHSQIVTEREAAEAAEKAGSSHSHLPLEQESGYGASGSGFSRHISDSGTESTPDTPEIGTKVGHSILGVAPVLLTATAIYR